MGWSAYPWSRGAFEAICAEESIALADAALYRAKAFGRNQGVGILATDAAGQSPEAINLVSVREGKPPFARIVKTECPGAETSNRTEHVVVEQVVEHADKSDI